MLKRLKPLVLPILNGFGHSLAQENNTIAMADTPCGCRLRKVKGFGVIVCNHADCDRVGHALDGQNLLTAGYGNSGRMVGKEIGLPRIAHITNHMLLVKAA